MGLSLYSDHDEKSPLEELVHDLNLTGGLSLQTLLTSGLLASALELVNTGYAEKTEVSDNHGERTVVVSLNNRGKELLKAFSVIKQIMKDL